MLHAILLIIAVPALAQNENPPELTSEERQQADEARNLNDEVFCL